mmetsp:Transcript_7510/g.14682  ORF Transcript_7510/g.14682 Transcript_7510/m.14682 type:complete len:304 (+) Transcript_7510:1838-2749(+)
MLLGRGRGEEVVVGHGAGAAAHDHARRSRGSRDLALNRQEAAAAHGGVHGVLGRGHLFLGVEPVGAHEEGALALHGAGEGGLGLDVDLAVREEHNARAAASHHVLLHVVQLLLRHVHVLVGVHGAEERLGEADHGGLGGRELAVHVPVEEHHEGVRGRLVVEGGHGEGAARERHVDAEDDVRERVDGHAHGLVHHLVLGKQAHVEERGEGSRVEAVGHHELRGAGHVIEIHVGEADKTAGHLERCDVHQGLDVEEHVDRLGLHQRRELEHVEAGVPLEVGHGEAVHAVREHGQASTHGHVLLI